MHSPVQGLSAAVAPPCTRQALGSLRAHSRTPTRPSAIPSPSPSPIRSLAGASLCSVPAHGGQLPRRAPARRHPTRNLGRHLPRWGAGWDAARAGPRLDGARVAHPLRCAFGRALRPLASSPRVRPSTAAPSHLISRLLTPSHAFSCLQPHTAAPSLACPLAQPASRRAIWPRRAWRQSTRGGAWRPS